MVNVAIATIELLQGVRVGAVVWAILASLWENLTFAACALCIHHGCTGVRLLYKPLA